MTARTAGPRSVRAGAAVAAALTLSLLIGATGCTSSGSSSASSAVSAAGGVPAAGVSEAAAATSAAAAAATSAAAAAAAPASAAAATSGAAAPSQATSGALEGRPGFQSNPQAGRSVIYTATVDVQVNTPADVAAAADEAAKLADDAQGYVFSRDGQAADSGAATPAGETPAPAGVAEADLVIKVPPGSLYDTLLSNLEHLGHEQSVDENSQDVTNQVVDTTARLSTMKASVARVRTLLAQAKTIGQIVEVEGELTKREADLESLEGTLNVLKSQTSLATITLHLQSAPPTPKAVAKPTPKPKHPIHGFLSGLKAGGRGFATVAIGIATVLGAVLPFLGVLIVLALLAWWGRRAWLRSHRTGHTEQATT
jgi:Domain of unknown function (DUF4349)